MKLFKPAYEKDPHWQLSNWRGFNPEKSNHHTAVLALRRMKAEVSQAALTALIRVQPGPGGNPYDVAHMSGEIRWRIKSFGLGADVVAIAALLEIAENAEFREIDKVVGPMIAAVEAADKKAEAQRLAEQRAQADLSIARESVKEKLLASIESSPEVVAARDRVERSKIAAGAS